jgi:hypothetical protein
VAACALGAANRVLITIGTAAASAVAQRRVLRPAMESSWELSGR